MHRSDVLRASCTFRSVVKPSWWRPASFHLGQSSTRPRQPRALIEILACEMPACPRRSAGSSRSLDGADMATPANMHICLLPLPFHLHSSRRGPRPVWVHAQVWHPCPWDPCTDKTQASQADPSGSAPAPVAVQRSIRSPTCSASPQPPEPLKAQRHQEAFGQLPADLTASHRGPAVSKLAAKKWAWFSVLSYIQAYRHDRHACISQMHGEFCRGWLVNTESARPHAWSSWMCRTEHPPKLSVGSLSLPGHETRNLTAYSRTDWRWGRLLAF